MGARGPRKKLPILDNLDGNPGRRPLDFGIEIEATPGIFVPEHLSDDAQACVEVIRASMPPALYAKVDSFLLAAFATAWAIHKRAAFEMSNPEAEWIVTNSAGSLTASPWIKMATQQAQLMASLGDRLGLDPKARAGLKLPAEKAKSKFDGLTGGQQAGVAKAN